MVRPVVVPAEVVLDVLVGDAGVDGLDDVAGWAGLLGAPVGTR